MYVIFVALAGIAAMSIVGALGYIVGWTVCYKRYRKQIHRPDVEYDMDKDTVKRILAGRMSK